MSFFGCSKKNTQRSYLVQPPQFKNTTQLGFGGLRLFTAAMHMLASVHTLETSLQRVGIQGSGCRFRWGYIGAIV